MPNRLIHETSPYLLQHAHNPVDWHAWDEEALNRSKREDKPILLSVGYSACHWCHVMERESFENETIAELMNHHFVCIKVDREERPDIDQIYMESVQMMSGQGGWPMTVFLTPDGKPFYGGTYYPPDDRYGRPGFPRVLMAVAEAWRDRRDAIEEQGLAMVTEMNRRTTIGASPEPITPDVLDRAYSAIRGGWDMTLGGFAGAPKFPQPMILDFLMRYAHRTKRQEPMELVELTLEKMAFGGMYDQIGGGFHRYSTDQYWLVPHFEKMLYDNAQLAATYLRAWQATKDPLYRRICEETLDYVLREMTDPAGGFYSAQDADSEGEEGKFFVWTPAEVEAVLGKEDADLFCKFYDITERGNFEEKSIPNITATPDAFARSIGKDPTEFEAWRRSTQMMMYGKRASRFKPARDEKILTSWNALMLGAFADAGAVLNRPDYVQAAKQAASFLLKNLRPDGKLLRTGKTIEGNFRPAPIPAFLEDYACLIDSLIRLYQADFDRSWLNTAAELADEMISQFTDPEGGFFDTASDSESLVRRPKDLMDNATPSGNSVAIESLLKLAVIFDRDDYRNAAAGYLRKMKSSLERYPQAFARLLCAADLYLGPIQELAIIGDPESEDTKSFLESARAPYTPNLLVMMSATAVDAASFPLLKDKSTVSNKTTAYVCQNYACAKPITDPAELNDLLRTGYDANVSSEY